MLGDVSQVAVALRGCCPGGVARHGAGPGRHDHGCFGRALGDLAIDAVLVIGTVRREQGERTRLVKQGADLGSVIGVAGGEHSGKDPPGVGIHPDVQLAPGPAGACAVLLKQPLARAAQLQPGAVHQQVHGTSAGPRQ